MTDLVHLTGSHEQKQSVYILNKVDKVEGKGLSTEDFTGAHKTKLEGLPSDVAPLVDGKIPSANLPSYVDDVLEYANFASLPVTGENGKIYTTTDNNKIYRWSGTTYVEISASPGSTDAVPEGSVNLYHTVARAQAAAKMVSETTVKTGAFPVFKEATVSGGNAVFHLTVDGLSTGAALFPNGVDLKSIQLCAVDSDAPASYGTPTLSNGNKTLTVSVKKSTGINVALLGLTLLGSPVAANGTVVRLLAFGN